MENKMSLLIVSLFVLSPLTQAAVKRDYYNLYKYLFDDVEFYNKNVRPAVNESHPIIVNVNFYLSSIIDVDEKEQTLVTTATVQMTWDDNYLSWDPNSYGGLSTLLVPQMNIYLPDLIVSNSVRTRAQMGFPQQRVRLRYDGQITWEPSILLVTACDIDITYFPFDTQICHIKFETAVSSNEEILLKLVKADIPFSLDDFAPNGQWILKSKSSEDHNFKGHKASVVFGLQLQRRRVFYVLNIVLPIFFLSLTASLVFALPADEGEKMGTGITVLLAFAVYLTIVSDLVPNTSLQVSTLGLYLTTLLGMSAVSVVVCVFILRLHFRDDDIPVGTKTIKLTKFLRRLTCYKTDKHVERNKVSPLERDEAEISPTGKNRSQEDNYDGTKKKSFGEEASLAETEAAITWKEVAKTLDEFCFGLFSCLSIAITLFCLLTLSVGGEINAPQLEFGEDVFNTK